MTLSTSLRGAARTLIDTFGNAGVLYPYSSATKTENSEGDVAVSSWGAGSAVLVVDGDNVTQELSQGNQAMETLGEDEKIVRDDVTIAVNDRLDVTSPATTYRVVELRPIVTQSVTVVQIIKVAREDITTQW